MSETFRAPYAGSDALAGIDLSKAQITNTIGTGDFDQASLNSSGHQNIFANAEECGDCGRPATHSARGGTMNRCDRCWPGEEFAAASTARPDLPREKRNVLSSIRANYDPSFSWASCSWGPYFNRFAAEGSNKFYSVWVWERAPGIYTAMGAYGGLGQNPRLFNVGQTRDLQQAVNMAKKKLQSKQKKGYQTYSAEYISDLSNGIVQFEDGAGFSSASAPPNDIFFAEVSVGDNCPTCKKEIEEVAICSSCDTRSCMPCRDSGNWSYDEKLVSNDNSGDICGSCITSPDRLPGESSQEMMKRRDTPEYKAARKVRSKKNRQHIQKNAPYLKVKGYENHKTGLSYLLDVGLPSQVLLHKKDLKNSGMKIDEIDTIQVYSQDKDRFPMVIDSRFVGKAAEDSAPVQDPMEFGEMANWTPLDGSEGLKRKRAESQVFALTYYLQNDINMEDINDITQALELYLSLSEDIAEMDASGLQKHPRYEVANRMLSDLSYRLDELQTQLPEIDVDIEMDAEYDAWRSAFTDGAAATQIHKYDRNWMQKVMNPRSRQIKSMWNDSEPDFMEELKSAEFEDRRNQLTPDGERDGFYISNITDEDRERGIFGNLNPTNKLGLPNYDPYAKGGVFYEGNFLQRITPLTWSLGIVGAFFLGKKL